MNPIRKRERESESVNRSHTIIRISIKYIAINYLHELKKDDSEPPIPIIFILILRDNRDRWFTITAEKKPYRFG